MTLIIIVNVISSSAGGGIIILVLIKQLHHLLYHQYMNFSFQLLRFFSTSDLSRSVFNEAQDSKVYISSEPVWFGSPCTLPHTCIAKGRQTERTNTPITVRPLVTAGQSCAARLIFWCVFILIILRLHGSVVTVQHQTGSSSSHHAHVAVSCM